MGVLASAREEMSVSVISNKLCDGVMRAGWSRLMTKRTLS